MLCPFCRQGETKVVDSRDSEEFVIRRRRQCLQCNRRFTTYEKIEDSPLKVVKKDGTRMPFDRDKIRSGMEKACYKRPVSAEQIDRIISEIETDVAENFEREVPSRYIGEKLIDALRQLDQVAYVRFASVYREFQDVNDFVEELQPMLQQLKTRRRTTRD
jgi:transcriptional repressor NrdR